MIRSNECIARQKWRRVLCWYCCGWLLVGHEVEVCLNAWMDWDDFKNRNSDILCAPPPMKCAPPMKSTLLIPHLTLWTFCHFWLRPALSISVWLSKLLMKLCVDFIYSGWPSSRCANLTVSWCSVPFVSYIFLVICFIVFIAVSSQLTYPTGRST